MRISILTPDTNKGAAIGYGTALAGMYTSLELLGHTVSYNDPDAPVEIAFCQPYIWHWTNPKAYHIGYVPWESTKIPEEWFNGFRTADEIWTTSEWCKQVFENKTNKLENVRVYPHGVDAFTWQRKRRRWNPDRPLRFLHMGEPAPRKGGQLVHDTFLDLFEGRDDVTLTIKAHDHNTIRGIERFGLAEDGGIYLFDQPNKNKNVKLITRQMEEFELVDLVRRHDVLVYPSWGEGFGLIPLQAMATGMPVICPPQWAPYADLLVPELRLPAQLARSPWQEMHPGNMYEPDRVALRAIMESMSDPGNFLNASVQAYRYSFDVETQYDWTALTKSAFAHIVEKFS